MRDAVGARHGLPLRAPEWQRCNVSLQQAEVKEYCGIESCLPLGRFLAEPRR